jgi:hypothetical protein
MYSLVEKGLELLSPQDSNVTVDEDNFSRKLDGLCEGLSALAQRRSHGDCRTPVGQA